MKCSIVENYPDFVPRDKKGIWIFKLNERFKYKSNLKEHSFSAQCLKIYPDGVIEIPSGYAWDGCTPKFSIFDIGILGTPDGIISHSTGKPKTYYASVVHDALYQYYSWHNISRKEIEWLFLRMMQDSKFKLSRLYHIAVCIFGCLFVKKKSPERNKIEFIIEKFV